MQVRNRQTVTGEAQGCAESRRGKIFRNGGFTLIEILVAIVIISIIIAAATLSIGNPGGDALRQEAQKLEALITLAREEAILQSRELGLSFDRHGYRFFENAGGWQELQKDEALRHRELPNGMESELILEGVEVKFADFKLDKDEKETPMPQIFIMSSGEITPFSVQFSFKNRPKEYMELKADALANITISDSSQDDDFDF